MNKFVTYLFIMNNSVTNVSVFLPISPIVCVYSHMFFQRLESWIALLADFTLEVTFPGVSRHMIVKSEASEEFLSAYLAIVSGKNKTF